MRILTISLLAPLVLLSCSERDDNPISSQTQFVVGFPTDTARVFPGTMARLVFPVSGQGLADVEPTTRSEDFVNYSVNGPWFVNPMRDSLYVNVWGSDQTFGVYSRPFEFTLGGSTLSVPIAVSVSDFYFADRIATNCPNDTIVIPRGGNFLLKLTCYDTLNCLVSRSQIESITHGVSYHWYWNSSNQKFVFTTANRDTTHFYVMFTAFEDITPSEDDRYLYWELRLSNKSRQLPIRIVY